MKELTISQISAIKNLAKKPLISSASIDFHNDGQSRITITSAINAEWNGPDGVDSLLNSELDETFPNLEYLYPPTKKYYSNKTDHEYYFLGYEGDTEALICLIMCSERNDSIGQA
jgi:hypothetical protein